MRYIKNSKLLMVLAMAIFGTIPLFVRHLPLSSGEIALYRAYMAILLVGGFLLVTKQKLPLKVLRQKHRLPLLLVSGAALGFNWILLFEAYKYTTVSTATLCYYFAPIIVTIASVFLFHERLTGMQILCFIMSTVGLVLITGLGRVGSSDLLGMALGLGAAVLYATVVLVNKTMGDISGIHRTFLQFSVTAVILTPYVAFTEGFHLYALNGMGWGMLLTMGVLHTGIAYCLYFSAVHHVPGQKVAIISYLDPLIAVLVSVFALGECITPLQIIGGAMILGFSLLNELVPTRR
ncbi:MAG: EamA/RhaT family transporter [Ruminococcaceae bacterium]|nr:EamA/RhaT family transporter [Oscillospiraceae bacterium]